MTSPDVYKEKWFHGKIGRDEVSAVTNGSRPTVAFFSSLGGTVAAQ